MVFSGKLAKIDNDELRRLFGPMIPIEAVNVVFKADGNRTLGDVRSEIERMAAEWDPALSQLNRLLRARMGIVSLVLDAEERYSKAGNPDEKALLIQLFIDAADVLDAAHDDLAAVMREED